MSSPEKRKTFNNLVAGCVFGALAAAGGAAVILGFLVVILLSVSSSLDGLIITFFVCVTFILLAGLLGAIAGLLVAVVDTMVGGRLHDGQMPFWAWWPIGGVMGAVAAAPIGLYPISEASTAATSFYAIMGALSGLVAGPVFGLLYRHKQKVEA